MDTKTGLSVQVTSLGNVGKAGRATFRPQDLRGWGVGGGVLEGLVVSGRASGGVGILKPKSASDTFSIPWDGLHGVAAALLPCWSGRGAWGQPAPVGESCLGHSPRAECRPLSSPTAPSPWACVPGFPSPLRLTSPRTFPFS